ncbi:MAG: C1 family peptidase [Myxococcota bacterium]
MRNVLLSMPFLIILISNLYADNGLSVTLEEVQRAIIENNLYWTASETIYTKMTPEQRKSVFGLIIPRGYKSPKSNIASTLKMSLPATFDWRNNNGNYVTTPKDQGYCGSCWAFASTGAIESKYMITKKSPGLNIDLAEQILVSCDMSNYGCNGGLLANAASFLQDSGIYTESCFPYNPSTSDPSSTRCSKACADYRNKVKYYKIKDFIGVAQDVNEIKAAVYQYGPVPVGMIACDDYQYYNSGVYKHRSGSCSPDSGHGVLVVGWDDYNNCFIVKNSGGRYWGENGYFRIDYSEVRDCYDSSRETFTCTSFGQMGVAYGDVVTDADAVQVTIATDPTSLELNIDNTVFKAPKTFTWIAGSSHSVNVKPEQKSADGRYKYYFDSRSDGKNMLDVIIAPSVSSTITFKFKTQYQFKTSLSDVNAGKVSPYCSPECWLDPNSPITLSATANAGYEFTGFTGDITTTQNPYQFTMSKPTSVVANFKKSSVTTYTITASAGSNGKIEPSGIVNVPQGGSQTFIITPNQGYHIDRLLVDGNQVASTNSYTFSNVTSNHTISVAFALNSVETYKIVAQAGEGGSISPSGTITVSKGGSQRFTITPYSQYAIQNVLVDGKSQGKISSYTFSGVTADHQIYAAFEKVSTQKEYKKLSITYKGNGGGTVYSYPSQLNCTKDCSGWFEKGVQVVLTAIPDSKSNFEGWNIGSCGKNKSCTIRMDYDMPVTAYFSLKEGQIVDDGNTAESANGEVVPSSGCSCSYIE